MKAFDCRVIEVGGLLNSSFEKYLVVLAALSLDIFLLIIQVLKVESMGEIPAFDTLSDCIYSPTEI